MDSEVGAIENSIKGYLNGNNKNRDRKPCESYTSFDYCYNYFYSFYRKNRIRELASPENLQMSSLQLGFYLASHGLMKGSSFLLKKSLANYKDLIITISKMNPGLWEIDVDSYNRKNIQLLLACKEDINEALGRENKPGDALITRIMLGVFANIPCFDQYFKNSFELRKVNEKSLVELRKFYESNRPVFDSFEVHTLDFLTSRETDVKYTKAKLMDIYGFMDGQLKKPKWKDDFCCSLDLP
jgi:hypothetical protein